MTIAERRLPDTLVQLQNPKTKHWVVIDKGMGKIVKHSRTSKPYKNISIVRRKEDGS